MDTFLASLLGLGIATLAMIAYAAIGLCLFIMCDLINHKIFDDHFGNDDPAIFVLWPIAFPFLICGFCVELIEIYFKEQPEPFEYPLDIPFDCRIKFVCSHNWKKEGF